MRKVIFFISSVVIVLMCSGLYSSNPDKWDENTPLSTVLYAMGAPIPSHYRETLDLEKVRMGKEMVSKGRATKTDGSKSRFISKFFVCTDCHNQVQEDPFLSDPNPEDRLAYAVKNNLNYLQATTFWGVTNRTTWYNGDYEIKYGSLVDKAKTSLEESTQLCAKECSSGRHLEAWELECIVQYYGSLQIKLGDLNLGESDWRKIRILSGSEKDRKELGSWLVSKIMTASPATFIEHQEYKAPTENLDQAYEDGKNIYALGCQTCHRTYGPSQYVLETNRSEFRRFRKHLGDHGDFDAGQIIRNGTHAEPGHLQYMPLYTAERLSENQMNSLVYYMLNWQK